MTSPSDCTHNVDPLKLVHGGTSQDERLSAAPDPAHALINEHPPAHAIVFAQAYAAFLRYYDPKNNLTGDWRPFFKNDVSAYLAIAAVQDVDYYRRSVKEYADFLNDRHNSSNVPALRDHLDYLFSVCATLATRINEFARTLTCELERKSRQKAAIGFADKSIASTKDEIGTFSLSLKNIVRSQLAPALKRLIAYRKGGEAIVGPQAPLNDALNEKAAPIGVLGGAAVKCSSLSAADLSSDWHGNADWANFYNGISGDQYVYGVPLGPTAFDRINYIANHNLFTSVLDQFLKAYARIVNDAQAAVEVSLTKWDHHEPHYALFLAFLRLFEYARAQANTLTGRHLDFYYREILRLKEKPPKSGSAHLLVELAKHVPAHELKAGELFKAGKDDRGIDAFFANDRDFIANQAKVAALKTVYRHGDEKVGISAPTAKHEGRLYASPVANSEDGLGAELTSVDQSWHPFCHNIYQDGMLAEIRMPKAEIGFAIASHYLWMAEGTRTITVDFTVGSEFAGLAVDRKDDLVCLLTSEKGWIEKTPLKFITESSGVLRLEVALAGADPAITPYVTKTHGYDFATNLPILLVKLRHQDDFKYIYSQLQDVVVQKIDLKLEVEGLKTLAVSNDFGPVDTSKPFQPYGASPTAGSALIIGSKEIFQKTLTNASINVTWLTAPSPYKTSPSINIDFLNNGQWLSSNITPIGVSALSYTLGNNLNLPVVDTPDLSPNEFYNTASRHGFVRLRLSNDFGQNAYQRDLVSHLRGDEDEDGDAIPHPGDPPVGPLMSALSMNYEASQTITLNSVDATAFEQRKASFIHLTLFGQAEQYPVLSAALKVSLLPQFDFQRDAAKHESAAEFYIGVTGLKPPQNVALLFQVADGSADPLSQKPEPHIHWSYLRGNEWIAFAESDVSDQTGGLLNSGIITFAMPRDASDANTLLPAQMHWIRAAVASAPEAVCRLIMVAAQALNATFSDKQNDPAFSAKVLAAGTISKLDQPDAAVKKITQPFASFGGRGAENAQAFYTRVSERLRHKERAVAMWDYERLILEAFPQLYRAKCLNHTHYEPTDNGLGIYRELAPGHVTIVTIPKQQLQNLRDPLRPYTSLGLLKEIETFMRNRLSCFAKLHVRNPQFEEVFTDLKVRLASGFDETFYRNKLQEEITHFLSPWAFSGSTRPTFGGKVLKSVLINYVEERPYVDYVTDFKLFHKYKSVDGSGVETETVSPDLSEIEGSRAVSVLVSVPSKNHLVQVINPSEQEQLGEDCPCEA
jgi:hypothetical protein